MTSHVHISALSFLVVALYIVIFGIVWRTVSARFSDTSFGKAMSIIY